MICRNPLWYLLLPIALLGILAGVLTVMVNSATCTMAGHTYSYGQAVGVTASGDLYTVPSPVVMTHAWSCTDNGWVKDW